jgi:hypothetical protein
MAKATKVNPHTGSSFDDFLKCRIPDDRKAVL